MSRILDFTETGHETGNLSILSAIEENKKEAVYKKILWGLETCGTEASLEEAGLMLFIAVMWCVWMITKNMDNF